MSAVAQSTLQASAPAGRAERLFVVLVLLLSTGAFLNLLPQVAGRRAVAGHAGMQAVWATLYLGVFFLLFRHCKGFIRALASDRWLLALLILAFLSTAWSDDPSFTFKRSIGLLGTYLCAVYLASRYDLRAQLRLVAWALGPAVLLSLPFGAFGIGSCPNSALDAGGDWCGVYPNKNGLGAMMAFAFVVFVMMSKLEPARRWAMRLLAGLAFALLLLSGSKTSLVALLGFLAMLLYSRFLRGSARRAFGAVALAGAAGTTGIYWAFHHIVEVTALLGKNATFSGRLQLWILSFVMAMRKPWLGYGYGAFWLGREGPSARVLRAVGWQAYYAHNGLLELWLDVGLVGVLLFVVGFAIYASRALRFFRGHREVEYAWPLMFLTFMFLVNIPESSLLAPDSILWLLYVAGALVVSPAYGRRGSSIPNLAAQL